ncbi:MAG: peptidoglycan DD-metalloendopeptidase family protein [Lachnospiraceae bacterium]|nr:peptidoglycan DD-metalloendopeptidase family protein [Lachnospiraceae bacterium]
MGEHSGQKKNIMIAVVAIAVVLAFVLVIGVHISSNRALKVQIAELQRLTDALRANNTEQAGQIEELANRDAEQDKELVAMSKSLTTKTDELEAMQEQEAARYVPNIFPLRGNSSLIQETEITEEGEEEEPDEEEEEEPETEEEQMRLVIPKDAPSATFMTAAESRAIATADGTVVMVNGDAHKGYQIVLDHGNGYTTVYEGFGLALVSENDTVGRGSVLLYFVDEINTFTYWMRYEENWVDPLETIDING